MSCVRRTHVDELSPCQLQELEALVKDAGWGDVCRALDKFYFGDVHANLPRHAATESLAAKTVELLVEDNWSLEELRCKLFRHPRLTQWLARRAAGQ